MIKKQKSGKQIGLWNLQEKIRHAYPTIKSSLHFQFQNENLAILLSQMTAMSLSLRQPFFKFSSIQFANNDFLLEEWGDV